MKRNAVTVYGFVLGSALPDQEPLQPTIHCDFMDDEPRDMAPEVTIENCLQKNVDLVLFALDLQFDPAVNQVPNTANNIVAGSDRLDGEPEPDALHSPLIQDLFCDHWGS
jgi:hypothetical protein